MAKGPTCSFSKTRATREQLGHFKILTEESARSLAGRMVVGLTHGWTTSGTRPVNVGSTLVQHRLRALKDLLGVQHFEEVHRQVERNGNVFPHAEGDAVGVNPDVLQEGRKKLRSQETQLSVSAAAAEHVHPQLHGRPSPGQQFQSALSSGSKRYAK